MNDKPGSHDDRGMYVVIEKDGGFAVMQNSSCRIVAESALRETAERARDALNACAIVPNLNNLIEL